MVLAGPDRDAGAAAGDGGVPGQEGRRPGGLHRHAADQVSGARDVLLSDALVVRVMDTAPVLLEKNVLFTKPGTKD